MSITADKVVVELEAKLGRYEANVARAEQKFDRAMGNIQRSAGATEAFISRSMTTLGAALAGVSTIALARKFLEIADKAKGMEAQLRLATAAFGSFAQAQKDVDRIAANTRSGLVETTKLYGNFVRGAKELGATQAEAARATETFSKTLKISGAGAAESASATLQFGQALAAGALRGDELNSILESSPRLARLLAESMGQPIGQIKKLGEEGKLTSDKLLSALTDKKFTAAIDAEFRQLPVTFDDAMTLVDNAAIKVFGAFDKGGQFSAALASFILDGANGFEDLATSAEDFGRRTRAAIEGLAGAFQPVFDEAKRLFALFESGTGNLSFSIERELGDIDKLTGWLSRQGLGGRLLTGNSFGDWWNERPVSGTNLRDRYVANRDAANKRLKGEAAERDVNALINSYFDRFGNPVRTPPAQRSPATSSGGGAGRAKSAEAAARREEAERQRAIRDEASRRRESARLDDEILAAKEALATAAEGVLQFQLDAIENERKQRNADIETQVKLGELGREEADRRILINNELAGYHNDLARRRAAEAIAQRDAAAIRDRASTLRAEAQLADSRAERRDIERRILDLAYQEEEAAIRRAAANGEIADLDEALANLRRRRAANEERINRDTEGPLARRAREINSPDRVNDQIEQYVIDELDMVQDSIASALSKAIGTKDPLITGLINLFIEQVIMRPIAEALANRSGGGGLFGALGAGIAGIFGGFRAGGGPVTAGRAYVVGEQGREMFVPQQSGVIVPNHALSARASGSAPTIIQVDARGAVMNDQFARLILSQAQQYAADAGQAAYAGAVRDTPIVMAKRQRYG